MTVIFVSDKLKEKWTVEVILFNSMFHSKKLSALSWKWEHVFDYTNTPTIVEILANKINNLKHI